ncbi:hypothetical protein CFE53_02570 [Methanofervidicoccus sp. A16]|uniref:esterase-like activity of phytase family protein n=1 Tax=Methanofervidicoccus sp. A16 TaxID=2607662 RepID=UPI00118B68EB|nr:esterase-like activity of phytase family protein [Methanofervidicoccus sp. A16]AXI25096.1 hypothetical protein CFE53_02570 [Methanofervidicoccus sp. A16]
MNRNILLILLLGILSLAVCYGDEVNIAYVHEHFDSLLKSKDEVNVTGIVTAKFSDKLIVIQDDTAGIWLYNSGGVFSDVEVGDEINVVGTLDKYKGLREIVSTKVVILSHNNKLPDPKVVQIKDINNESLMGTLIKLYKVEATHVDGKKFKVADATGEIGGYIKYSDNNPLNTGDFVDLISVVGCYDNIQVNPRSDEDITIYPKTEAVIDISLGKVTFKNNKTLRFSYGIGSGAFYKDGIIYAITDRGPNIDVDDTEKILGVDAEEEYNLSEDGKIFPIPDYTPTIFLINASNYEIIGNITLKDKYGNKITGLTNPIPSTELAYDSNFNLLDHDPNGIDSEAIVVLSNGSFWIGEEYSPSILLVAPDGRIIKRIVPEGLEKYYVNATYDVVGGLPSIIAKRHLNRGIEALALSPDEKYLYFALQSPIDNPNNKNYKKSRIIRLFKYDLNNEKVVGEYVYTLDTPETFKLDNTDKQKKVKLSEMVCVGDDELIVLERVSATTKLYYVKLNGTNIYNTKWDDEDTQPCLDELKVEELKDYNITPLQKILVFDNGESKIILPKKIEGIARDGNTLYLLNDNDFEIEGDKSTISKIRIKIPKTNISQNYGSIFFIHLADIHICDDDEVNEVFGGTVPPVTTTEEAVEEVIRFQPEVVVQTGDIVALADRYDLDTDERWYKLVNATIYTPINKTAGIPFLFAPGNHDPAGITLDNVDKSDPRYGDGLLLKYLLSDKGKTYYSYDYGNYHFVVIDPVETEESGYRAVRLPREQLEWLRSDLEKNSDKFIIISYHQPLGSWEDEYYNEFLDIVSQYNGHILLIAGHTHDNRIMTINGVPEHQGGAVCGDWWQTGKTPDGNPIGYTIYYIENGTIYRFYKGIGYTQQINLLSPRDVVLNGTTPIELNVYYENKTIVNITYKIDNEGTLHPLNFTLINVTKTWWYNAKGDVIITPDMLDDRKHNITIIVTAKDGSTFNRTFHYKFSNNTIMKIAEIINDTNFNDYYGLFTTINGTISMVTRNGNLLQIVDDSGDIIIWAGDCKHDNFTKGQKVILRGQITQFKGTKELKLISGSDVIVYGFENISVRLIVLPNIETAYKNFSALKNKYVEVKGVVTAVFGDLVAIQDDTRGIELWLGEINHGPINLGDVVTVRGQLTTYNNMIEIVVGREEDLIINGSAPIPDPKEITINEIPENLGNLVIVKGLTVESVDDRKIVVSDGTNTTVLYCKMAGFNPSSIVKVGDKIGVVGIAHLYKQYYEILPRSKEDIIFSTTGNGRIITLNKGWNAISIPHRANISFSDPETVTSIITYYNNTWHNKTNLEPLYGYYIYCHNDTYMYIQYITPEKPTAPPVRDVYKGWNLVGVNPGKNDINGVRVIDFVLPVEDSWIMILDLDGNLYTKNDNLFNVLLYPYEVYWMYCKEDDMLAGRNLY